MLHMLYRNSTNNTRLQNIKIHRIPHMLNSEWMGLCL